MERTIQSKVMEKVQQCNFFQYLNIQMTSITEGAVEASVVLSDQYLQQQGIAHGGLISTLADSVAGFAAVSAIPETSHVVTVELKISFLRTAKGDRLSAKGWVLKQGRSLLFCEAEVWAEEMLVAKATATMAVINPPAPAGNL